MDDTWVDIPPPRPQPTGPSGICSYHVGPMLARGSQHRIAYLGQEAMDHRYADTKSVIAWGRLGITTKRVAVVCCEPKPCCSGLTSCERLTVVSANSSFQDSSGSKKPYLCRRGSPWYKQSQAGQADDADPTRPRRASSAYWWLQGWRRTISLCSVHSTRLFAVSVQHGSSSMGMQVRVAADDEEECTEVCDMAERRLVVRFTDGSDNG